MSQKPESKLTKKMLDTLREQGAWAAKIVGGPASRGLPDIIACYHGVFLGLEVKCPGKEKTLTVLQSLTLKDIRKGGGQAYMVTSVKQVLNVLRHIDKLIEQGSA